MAIGMLLGINKNTNMLKTKTAPSKHADTPLNQYYINKNTSTITTQLTNKT